MNADVWEKAKKVFAEAIKLAPAERVHFLDEVCTNDGDTRREVESLLASFDHADSFMETPAVGEVAEEISLHKNIERGRCFGSYQIIEKIGSGGMGAVYLAHDKKLDRQVAVKILHEEFAGHEWNLIRFMREAKAASALNHPNILVIHEIGVEDSANFIVSEFISGETLREIFKHKILKFSEILDISIQIANALGAAHEANIVHRDIKPENIMLRPDGFIKILDFGLAKLIDGESTGFSNQIDSQNETAQGLILGTVNYMSPEQAKGEAVDERTDIFSFGSVIYEMLTGKTPFAGDSMPETFANLINSAVPPISHYASDVPDELERIVAKMLRKNKDERSQTMSEVTANLKSLRENPVFHDQLEKVPALNDKNTAVIALSTIGGTARTTAATSAGLTRQIKQHRLAAALACLIALLAAVGFGLWSDDYFSPPPIPIESIAVMPFENQNSETEYLSDGLTETVINHLSRLAELRVISRNSVFNYKGQEADPVKAGRELNVQSVLTGVFVEQGDNLLIHAELTEVRDHQKIWERQYSGHLNDIFALQQEISRDISVTLRGQLTDAEQQQLAKRETDSPEAYQLYLKGRYYWNKRSVEGFEKAVDFFNQAIDQDPTYAPAYVGLADCYLAGQFTYIKTRQARAAMVQAAADKALEIDPKSGEAHAALAINKCYFEWDWAGAEKEYRLAIELNPNYATAHQWYAELLAMEGRFDESFAEYHRAFELDPLSLAVSTDLAFNYYYAHQFDRAVEQLKKSEELNPNYERIYWFLGFVYQRKEMFEEAIEADDKFYSLLSANPQRPAEAAKKAGLAARKAILEKALKTSGAKGYWKTMIDLAIGEGNPDPVSLATFYVGLGNRDKAFELLEKAYQDRNGALVWLKVSPEFDNIRSDPRFVNLVHRIGLPY